MKYLEFKIIPSAFDEPKISVHTKTVGTPRAELAMKIMCHCALVAGAVDGEDSSGRQKRRTQTIEETALRAAGLADKLFDIFEADATGKWLVDAPSLAEIDAVNAIEKAVREKECLA